MKKKTCPIRKNKFFGDEVIHTWGYITKENRKCMVCKVEELYFGTIGTTNLGDWRTKYKNI